MAFSSRGTRTDGNRNLGFPRHGRLLLDTADGRLQVGPNNPLIGEPDAPVTTGEVEGLGRTPLFGKEVVASGAIPRGEIGLTGQSPFRSVSKIA